jgi:hypothetical protein
MYRSVAAAKRSASAQRNGARRDLDRRCWEIVFEFKLAPDQYRPYVKAQLERPRPIPDEPKDEDYFELTALARSGEILRGRLLYPQVQNDTAEVAAETLIEACYPQYTQLEQGLESHINALEQKIREDKAILACLRDSLAGLVGNFRRPSSSRGLKVFVYTQVRNRAKAKDIFEDWRKLRNASAHGSRRDPEGFYETNRRYNVVLDLCYSMVLSRIGYYGPRLVYGEPVGDPWNLQPVRQLPVPRPKMSAEQISKMVRSKPWKEIAGAWMRAGRRSIIAFHISRTAS